MFIKRSKKFDHFFGLCLAVAMVSGIGCNDQTTPEKSGAGKNQDASAHDHDHAKEGPHHGTLIELGDEEYHAELVHSGNKVTLYLLDKEAKNAVTVPLTELNLAYKKDGKPVQAKLAAVSGTSTNGNSEFAIEGEEVAKAIDDPASEARFTIDINGKSYRGDIEHGHDDHSHEGHDH